MLKQLVIIALLVVGFWAIRHIRRRLSESKQQRTQRNALYKEMVRCAQCGAHVLRSRAVAGSEDEYFCDEAHRLARRHKHGKE